jgi:hypothetical protein
MSLTRNSVTKFSASHCDFGMHINNSIHHDLRTSFCFQPPTPTLKSSPNLCQKRRFINRIFRSVPCSSPRKTWFLDRFLASANVCEGCVSMFGFLYSQSYWQNSCSLALCMRADFVDRNLHSHRRYLHNEKRIRNKEWKKKWKQNIFLIRAFFPFIQFMILGTCCREGLCIQ